MAQNQLKIFKSEEVAKHNSEKDCWLIIENRVYDVTPFLPEHPGGKKVVLKEAGKESTEKFKSLHNEEVLKQHGPKLLVGFLAGTKEAKEFEQSQSGSKEEKKENAVQSKSNKSVASLQPKNKIHYLESLPKYGEGVPFGDPMWYQGASSTYYNDSHIRFRASVREFVEKNIIPFCHKWDEEKYFPKEIYKAAYEGGWLPAVIGPPWPKDLVGTNIAGGVKVEEFDQFHELILLDEVSRCGSGGVCWAIAGGLAIGLPPIMRYGSKEMKEKIAGQCLRGEKVICLAITEPYAGSDVANLRCEAKLSEDGKHYIVNGEKKWITNGVFADYFTVAVRTGDTESGMFGLSMLLIERTMPGVKTQQMKCSGVWPSGTSYITFEDVKVPVENLIGNEGEGFKSILANFNHERWGIAAQATRFARVCFEEAFKYAHKRRAFNKRLIDQPVIRNKLAHMARQIEATQAWVESITFQMTRLTYKQQAQLLGGPIALLKAQATQTFEYCAREATQIFGGLAYTRGGQGEKVERLYREVRAYSIPGGSEEIMLDLGLRQAMRMMPEHLQNAKV
eukprot:TRINITY_DN5050_c0_g1_i1.p1 TRINITY_DN5050_c0_g1~~TRINITY_DN5050_c0_g1_i1.p1  ORF type:complete len:563 (-),score=249.06 TRINITY_DN5050_c0_g1_i1:118-1806(-)